MRVKVADITEFTGDAIVNAANAQLREGSGVCGAIFKKADQEGTRAQLSNQCRAHISGRGDLRVGDVAVTSAWPGVRHILHAVGPKYGLVRADDHAVALLTTTYANVLQVANDLQLETVAIPAISTGVFGFPPHMAAAAAKEILNKAIWQFNLDVTVYLLDHEVAELYQKVGAPR
jgi:O-acetyl-ADP-ribose deacetylase (regulator of RNase III)